MRVLFIISLLATLVGTSALADANPPKGALVCEAYKELLFSKDANQIRLSANRKGCESYARSSSANQEYLSKLMNEITTRLMAALINYEGISRQFEAGDATEEDLLKSQNELEQAQRAMVAFAEISPSDGADENAPDGQWPEFKIWKLANR